MIDSYLENRRIHISIHEKLIFIDKYIVFIFLVILY